jgi:hypothetical protein
MQFSHARQAREPSEPVMEGRDGRPRKADHTGPVVPAGTWLVDGVPPRESRQGRVAARSRADLALWGQQTRAARGHPADHVLADRRRTPAGRDAGADGVCGRDDGLVHRQALNTKPMTFAWDRCLPIPIGAWLATRHGARSHRRPGIGYPGTGPPRSAPRGSWRCLGRRRWDVRKRSVHVRCSAFRSPVGVGHSAAGSSRRAARRIGLPIN